MSKHKSDVTEQKIRIDEIDEHPENYQDHPTNQIAGLRVSLRTFGQVKDVVVQERPDDRFLMVAGHGLLTAARLEGWDLIGAKVIPQNWSEMKVKAYLVADNDHGRHALQDDIQRLSILEEAQQYDDTLLKAMSYSEAELQAIQEELGDDAAKDVSIQKTEVREPPQMAWVLIGVPLAKYGRIDSTINQLSRDPDFFVETTVNDTIPGDGS
jgi:hypothetical protein